MSGKLKAWTKTAGGTRPARKNTGRGQGRFTAAKSGTQPGGQPMPKNAAARLVKKAAGPIAERTAPAKQTEKGLGVRKVEYAEGFSRNGWRAHGPAAERVGQDEKNMTITKPARDRICQIFGKTAAASPNEDSPGPKHTAARLPKQSCPQKSKNDARAARKTNAAAAAIKSTPERFT